MPGCFILAGMFNANTPDQHFMLEIQDQLDDRAASKSLKGEIPFQSVLKEPRQPLLVGDSALNCYYMELPHRLRYAISCARQVNVNLDKKARESFFEWGMQQ